MDTPQNPLDDPAITTQALLDELARRFPRLIVITQMRKPEKGNNFRAYEFGLDNREAKSLLAAALESRPE